MQMTFMVTNMDCAACAAKVERAVSKIKGVKEANMSFLTQKLTVKVDETAAEDLENRTSKAVSRVMRGAKIKKV